MDRKGYNLARQKAIQDLVDKNELSRKTDEDLKLLYDEYIDIGMANYKQYDIEKEDYLDRFQLELDSRLGRKRFLQARENVSSEEIQKKLKQMKTTQPEGESSLDKQYREDEEDEELFGFYNPHAAKNSRDANLAHDFTILNDKVKELEISYKKYKEGDEIQYLRAQIEYFKARKALAEIKFKLLPFDKRDQCREEIKYCDEWLKTRRDRIHAIVKANKKKAYVKVK